MSIFLRLHHLVEAVRATKWGSLPPRDPVLADWFGGGSTTVSGAHVTPDSSLGVSAVYACVKLLSEIMGALPIHFYERTGDNTSRIARDHYLFELLHERPNPRQTPMQFKEMMMAHALLRGWAIALKVPGRTRAVAALNPLHPDRVQVMQRDNGELVYRYSPPNDEPVVLLPEQIFTLNTLSLDGISSLSPIQLHREAIGLSMRAEEHGAHLFSNGAQLGGVLKHPATLSDPAYNRLRKYWENKYSGAENAHKVGILEEGMEYLKVSMTAEESQFIETRKFSVEEICRIYRVPPHLIGHLDRSTFNNIATQGIEFVVFTMLAWFTRWEQAIARDLITDNKRYYAKVKDQVLLRGDQKSRYEAYNIGRNGGWLSANDIRGLEELPPIENGDQYLVPLNMVPADQAGQPQDEPQDDPPANE